MTDQILSLLIAEREKLNKAIEALQGPTKRRGRPPKNPLGLPSVVAAVGAAEEAPKRKGRTFSEEQRQAAAERMRARWAAKTVKPSKSKKSA